MKRILYILVLIIPFQVNSLFAQRSATEIMREVSMLKARNSAGGLNYGSIEGSPYYTDEFTDGTVFLRNGNSAAVSLRYDLFQDEIEFRQNDQVLWLSKATVLYVQYGDELLFTDSFPGAPGRLTYYFAQEKDKYALYMKKQVSFSPKAAGKGYEDPKPDRFNQDQDRYYLKEENTPPREIKNKKELLAILNENQAALDFIKKSKTKVKKEEDLFELVKFLNAH